LTGSAFNFTAAAPPMPAGGWRIGANLPWPFHGPASNHLICKCPMISLVW
jgi:hypothetical protein